MRFFDEHVSGGYFLVLPRARAAPMNATLLPETIITTSDCLVDLVPNTWAIAWASDSDEVRREAASKFALGDSGLAALTDWCTGALERGELAWPGVFFDPEVARRVKAERLAAAAGLVITGIALPNDLVGPFLEENRLAEGHGDPGITAALRRGLPPARGEILGYDVLGWDHGGFHSYICNGLETAFEQVLGIRPNRHGFFDRLEEARRCADHCNLPMTGAEPGLWLPWMTQRYDGAGADAVAEVETHGE